MKLLLMKIGIDVISSVKSDKTVECDRMAKMPDGGLLTKIKFSKDAKADEIKNIIEKASDLLSTFRPVKVAFCPNCGLKDEKLCDKCPKCKSPYIIN